MHTYLQTSMCNTHTQPYTQWKNILMTLSSCLLYVESLSCSSLSLCAGISWMPTWCYQNQWFNSQAVERLCWDWEGCKSLRFECFLYHCVCLYILYMRIHIHTYTGRYNSYASLYYRHSKWKFKMYLKS